jgi:hypothetical protein
MLLVGFWGSGSAWPRNVGASLAVNRRRVDEVDEASRAPLTGRAESEGRRTGPSSAILTERIGERGCTGRASSNRCLNPSADGPLFPADYPGLWLGAWPTSDSAHGR